MKENTKKQSILSPIYRTGTLILKSVLTILPFECIRGREHRNHSSKGETLGSFVENLLFDILQFPLRICHVIVELKSSLIISLSA